MDGSVDADASADCAACGVCVVGTAVETRDGVSASGIAFALDARPIARLAVGGKVTTLEGLQPRSWSVAFDDRETAALPRDAAGHAVLSRVVFDADGHPCQLGDQRVDAMYDASLPGVDAGNDAGSDGGSDAGSDGGSDAGSDGGSDAGSDGGSDAGP